MSLVPGFRHRPGLHCGSTALRNLLAHHGLELSEEMAFGLGAGPCFYYVTIEDASPSRWFNGRAARLEQNFAELTGAALRLRTFEPGDAAAWEEARATVDAGAPALLLTDIYHLDYYGSSAHFPGHAVVLAGYDERDALLADTGFEELQRTRIESLDRARHGDHPAFPLAGHMFTVDAAPDADSILAAAPAAIARAAAAMLSPEYPGFSGLDAVRRLADEIESWPQSADDWQWCARFGYQVIERRGTGGGNFRPMYARFLEELGRPEAGLAAAAGERWSELADALLAASEEDSPAATTWRRVGDAAALVAGAERRLWSELAG